MSLDIASPAVRDLLALPQVGSAVANWWVCVVDRSTDGVSNGVTTSGPTTRWQAHCPLHGRAVEAVLADAERQPEWGWPEDTPVETMEAFATAAKLAEMLARKDKP